MQKTYSFEFPGTKDLFYDNLLKYSHTNDNFYYFNDYIVDIHDNNYRFGIMRAGHSAGYWYEPTITESDGRIIFSGKIELKSYGESEKEKKNDRIDKYALRVLLFPLILLFEIVRLV